MGVSENRLNPIVPNGFRLIMKSRHEKWLAIIGKINPTFSVTNPYLLGGSSHLVSGWINPTYPIYNWGYNPLTKWDEPPSMPSILGGVPATDPHSQVAGIPGSSR